MHRKQRAELVAPATAQKQFNLRRIEIERVRIDIGNGVVITSSITNEAVDDLGLKIGDEAIAVIKASDVMVAK